MPHAPRDWPPARIVAVSEYGEALPVEQGKGPAPTGPQRWRIVTWGDLRQRVAVLSTALRAKGLRAGDRVAHVSANTSEPIVSFLACLAVGCVFSALPTDAGPQAIYGRLAQVQPRLVLTDDVAFYNGREVNVIDRVAAVVDDLVANNKVPSRNDSAPALEVVCIANQRRGKPAKLQWRGKQVQW